MRRAIVTGVCGGIGAAVAERLHASGWAVLGVDRSAAGPKCCEQFLSFDLARWSELDAALGDLVGDGRLDLLVNNAGVQTVEPIARFSDEALEETFAVNTFAPFAAVRALAATLGRSSGAIVNISSVHARATSQGMAVYAASKSALIGLTRAAALDLAPMGIRVNAVLPGAIDTAMLRGGMANREGGADLNRERLAAGTPLGRVGLVDEVAYLVEYLGDSGRSSFVTGQSYVVDGGALTRLGTE